jgi:hypothetical protein
VRDLNPRHSRCKRERHLTIHGFFDNFKERYANVSLLAHRHGGSIGTARRFRIDLTDISDFAIRHFGS